MGFSSTFFFVSSERILQIKIKCTAFTEKQQTDGAKNIFRRRGNIEPQDTRTRDPHQTDVQGTRPPHRCGIKGASIEAPKGK